MNVSRFFQRLIAGDHVAGRAAPSLRSVVAWLFIVLVALFLTQPAGAPASAFDAPVPWPAELGLDVKGLDVNLGGQAPPSVTIAAVKQARQPLVRAARSRTGGRSGLHRAG